MVVTVRFSTETVTRRVPVDPDTIERWQAIQAGKLPADDDTPRAPTDDQLDEQEREHLAEVEQWGRTREEHLRDEATAAFTAAERTAQELEDASAYTDPHEARALRRRATRLRIDAGEMMRDAQREMNDIAEQVRERRTELRAHLTRYAEILRDTEHERITHLHNTLDQEIQVYLEHHYFQQHGAFHTQTWHIL